MEELKGGNGTFDFIKTFEEAQLKQRLVRHGIRIAIDWDTQSAELVFNDKEAEAVFLAAEVYAPFDAQLDWIQRREVEAQLEYYERLIARRTAPSAPVAPEPEIEKQYKLGYE